MQRYRVLYSYKNLHVRVINVITLSYSNNVIMIKMSSYRIIPVINQNDYIVGQCVWFNLTQLPVNTAGAPKTGETWNTFWSILYSIVAVDSTRTVLTLSLVGISLYWENIASRLTTHSCKHDTTAERVISRWLAVESRALRHYGNMRANFGLTSQNWLHEMPCETATNGLLKGNRFVWILKKVFHLKI